MSMRKEILETFCPGGGYSGRMFVEPYDGCLNELSVPCVDYYSTAELGGHIRQTQISAVPNSPEIEPYPITTIFVTLYKPFFLLKDNPPVSTCRVRYKDMPYYKPQISVHGKSYLLPYDKNNTSLEKMKETVDLFKSINLAVWAGYMLNIQTHSSVQHISLSLEDADAEKKIQDLESFACKTAEDLCASVPEESISKFYKLSNDYLEGKIGFLASQVKRSFPAQPFNKAKKTLFYGFEKRCQENKIPLGFSSEGWKMWFIFLGLRGYWNQRVNMWGDDRDD